MRILLVCSQYAPLESGVAISARRLAQGLAASRHELGVIARDKHSMMVANGDLYCRRELDGNTVHYLSESDWCNRHCRTLNWIANYIDAFQPQIVHIYGIWYAGFWGLAAARLADVPLVLSCRGDDVTSGVLHDLPLLRSVLERADAVTAVASSLLDWVHEIADIRFSKRIPNAIDSDKFTDKLPGKQPHDGLRFGTLAEFRWKKGPEYLSILLQHLSTLLPQNASFTVMGTQSPELVSQLKDLFEQGSEFKRDFVSIPTPARDRIPGLLSELDMFLMTSIREGMPNTLLESLACGTPVAATAVDGCIDVLKGSKAGLLLDPYDPHAAAISICSAVRDRSRLQNMSEQACRLTRDKFSPDLEIDDVIDVYQKVLTERLSAQQAGRSLAL